MCVEKKVAEKKEVKLGEGLKHDTGKLEWLLLPWNPLRTVVRVLMSGRDKYLRDNWKRVRPSWRYADACFRHLIDWVSGEDFDPETGESHLAHAVCCLLFLLDHIMNGTPDARPEEIPFYWLGGNKNDSE
jgi:hypothetical protein